MLYEVITQIDEDVSLLWIVQPKDLSTATQYAIDQFVMSYNFV